MSGKTSVTGAGNIVLIGMRGSGKTTAGRGLAVRLRRPFLDLDDEIARLAGCSADELLAGRGEPAFRELERQALQAAAARRGHVIATGGGAVLHAEAFAALAGSGVVVWLDVPAEVLLERAARRPRPPLTALPPREELQALLSQREPLYRAAAQIVLRPGDGDPILSLLEALRAQEPH